MKKTLALGLLLPASQLCALEIQDYFALNGLVGAYQTNGGTLVEGSKEGRPIEAKVRANLTAGVPVGERWNIFGRMEYDLNFLNLKEGTDIKNGKLRKRYEYVGVEHDVMGKVWYGKDWGATYAHMPILKQAYLGFQDVAAGQATWRNSDTLLYKNQYQDWTFVVSTQLSDSERSFDYDDDAFTTDGSAFTISYGASPFYGDGFGIGYSYHDAGLYGAMGELYKDKGDATHNIGMNYRYGAWYIGGTVAKSDLNKHGKATGLKDYTYDLVGEYTYSSDLKFILHYAQVYGNWGAENERFVGYGIHYFLTSQLLVLSEGRFSNGGDSNTIEDTHVFGLEYFY